MDNNVEMIGDGVMQCTELIGKVMTVCDDFDCAVKLLKETPIINTIYYIIASSTKGMIITRG